jgi:hypothetical protein
LHDVNQALAECESELMYLLGIRADAAAGDVGSSAGGEAPGLKRGPPRSARPEIPTRFHEALQKTVELDFTEQPLSDVLMYLQNALGNEVAFVFKEQIDTPVTLSLRGDKLSLKAGLEALADKTDCCFIFRDYGVLVVNRDDAWQYLGAVISSDAPLTEPTTDAGGGNQLPRN